MASHPKLSAAKGSPIQRPPLPFTHLNPNIKNLDPSKVPPVKFQEIVRDGQSTVVARMKIATPGSHAFILRRLDTGAISLTTMFRTAFPTASEDIERKEATWVKMTYDTAGANKSGKARFAGTWVTPEVALEIAKDYHIADIIAPLAAAEPAPNIIFRKSSKSVQQPTPVASPITAQTHTAPPPQSPHPVKRRREGSPAAAPSPAAATPTRRSTRLRSPAPTTPANQMSPLKTPKTAIAVREHLATHIGSDETAVDEEYEQVVTVAQPSHEEDVREQKELIERLKAERAAALAQAAADHASEVQAAQKREREEETEYKLNIMEPEMEVEERALVSNSRVRGLANMPPERKQLAWGGLLFAAGAFAVTMLPSIPSFF